MGGMLAVRFVLLYPEMTEQLILENPIGLEDWKLKVPYIPPSQEFVNEMGKTKASVKRYMQENYFHGEWKEAYNDLLEPATAAIRAAESVERGIQEAAAQSDADLPKAVQALLAELESAVMPSWRKARARAAGRRRPPRRRERRGPDRLAATGGRGREHHARRLLLERQRQGPRRQRHRTSRAGRTFRNLRPGLRPDLQPGLGASGGPLRRWRERPGGWRPGRVVLARRHFGPGRGVLACRRFGPGRIRLAGRGIGSGRGGRFRSSGGGVRQCPPGGRFLERR